MSPDEFFNSQHWTASTKAYWLMGAQAVTGIGFDKGGAVQLLERIKGMMREIEEAVEPILPMRPLNKGELDYYRIPAKPFKKDGTLSSTMEKWMEKVQAKLYTQRDIKIGNEVFPIIGGTETIKTGVMKLSNQDDIKDWLLSQGWRPTMWNFKRDAKGKPARGDDGKPILTSPKLHEKGRLCPSLEAMDGDLIKKIILWLSLSNRKSVLLGKDEDKGWIASDRLSYDGRLTPGSSGITNTNRFKHKGVCNVPKAEDGVVLGHEMRGLFRVSRPGYVFVGYDAAALENRVEAHYVYKYKGGPEYAAEILDGDPHTKNAFVFYTEELAQKGLKFEEGIKDDPAFKPFRSRSKNGKYCLSFGGQGPKLAATLGLPEARGKQLFEDFWNANLPLKEFRDKVTHFWETVGNKKYVNGIDGRRIMTRSKHSLVNHTVQSGGAIPMDYAGLFMDKWLGGLVLDNEKKPCYSYKDFYVYRVIFYHDEYIYEVPEHLAEEIGEMGVRSIEQAGRMLKMRVPLSGSYKVGPTWASVH